MAVLMVFFEMEKMFGERIEVAMVIIFILIVRRDRNEWRIGIAIKDAT